MIPELDGVLTVSPSWQQLTAPSDADGADAAVRAERELLDRLTAGRYDVMLVFTSFSQSPWPVAHLGLLAGIGTRVVHSREFAGAVATHWVTPPPDTTHHVDRSLHLLEAIGVPAQGRTPSLRVPAAAYAAADELVVATLRRRPSSGPARRQRFALLVPGASCPSRRYPAARFGAAAAEIAAPGLPVLVAGTAAEAGLVDEVVRAAGSPDVRALPATGLPVFTALVARAAVALDQQLRRPAPRRRGRHAGRRHLRGDRAARRRRPARGAVRAAAGPDALLALPAARAARSTWSASTSRRSGSSPRHSGWRRPGRRTPTPGRVVSRSAASPSGGPASDVPASASPQEDRWPHIPTPWIA